MAVKTNITTPVGRLVMGSLYKPQDKDFDGKPLVTKTGANIGQARVDYFLAIAIPKGAETAWHQTEWGQLICGVGFAAFPQAAQRPDFAWKIEDGDSQIPNKRNRKPCDNEGWKGHWILKFSGGYAPKAYRMEGNDPVLVDTVDFIKPGSYVQIFGTIDGNGNQNNPGIYLNHTYVMLRGYGPEINFGVDVKEAGFGAAPLPAGVSAVPLARTMPALPSAPAVTPGPTASVSVMPNPAFLQVPQAPNPIPAIPAIPASNAAIPAPPAPVATVPVPPSSGPKMTAKANGASYQSFMAKGWDDANLIAHGYMEL